MSQYVTQTSDKKKKTAFKLCLFGGWMGLHHFYVGNIGNGFIYFMTFGLCLFGVLADLYSISMGTFRDNVGVPLRE
ncbi:MAG: TM2 domain-containing protein [Firmicutes bacterium]|nr:TM2 domain-containing protein [Bacillota bacterium]